MATDSADVFLDHLRASRLLEPAQLSELTSTPDAQNADPQLLAQCLVEMGWLTRFQVDHLREACNLDLKLGSYHLIDRLGTGGVGPAYKARRPGKTGAVALKVIRKNRLSAPPLVSRFMQDLRTAAQLQHEHIAPVVTVGQLGGKYLFAREFVEGTDLERQVRDNGPLSVVRACNAARQAALALHCAHTQGLEHRRIKASNLIAVSAEANGHGPSIKVVDFGLAQLTSSIVLPTQKPASAHPDLRSLGRALQFLLTGQTSDQRAVLEPDIRGLVDRLLENGFATAAEAAAALEPLCREAPPEPEPPAVIPVAAVPVENNGSVGIEAPPEPEPEALPVAVAVDVPAPEPEPEPEPEALPVAIAVVAAEAPAPEPEPIAVAVVAEAPVLEPEPEALPVAMSVTISEIPEPEPEPVGPVAEAPAPESEPEELPLAVAVVEPAPVVIPSLSLEEEVPIAVAVAMVESAEPIVAELSVPLPIEGIAVPIDAVAVLEPEPLEPVAVAAVLPPPEEMPAPSEPMEVPMASAVAFVSEQAPEIVPLSSDVAVITELGPSLAVAGAVVEAAADDIPMASAVAFVTEAPSAEEPLSAVIAVVGQPKVAPIEVVVAASETVIAPAPVVEPAAADIPLASAVAFVSPVEDVPIIPPLEAVPEVPLAGPVDVESATPLAEVTASVEAASSFNPVQELPVPELVAAAPAAAPLEGLALIPEPPLWTPGTTPLMHSGILTVDLTGPAPAEPVAESPTPALPPLAEASPLTGENLPSFITAEASSPFEAPSGFPGEAIAVAPLTGDPMQPANPFLSDAPEEAVTFPIGAAQGASRRPKPKMSWSLKRLSKVQMLWLLGGFLLNLVIAPILIYYIIQNMSPSPTPPRSSKRSGGVPPRAAPTKPSTDNDTLPPDP